MILLEDIDWIGTNEMESLLDEIIGWMRSIDGIDRNRIDRIRIDWIRIDWRS